MLDRFRKPDDPTSVELVDPRNLAASFGSGVKLERAYVEIADDAITHGVEAKLPWLASSNVSPPLFTSVPSHELLPLSNIFATTISGGCRTEGRSFSCTWQIPEVHFGVKLRRTQYEHMFSASHSAPDIARHSRHTSHLGHERTRAPQQLAPLFDLTSSARPSNETGRARPIAFAALRLSSSSFVDNCTVKSDGFSSLRMQRGFQVTT